MPARTVHPDDLDQGRLHEAVARRLAGVCAHLDDESFATLVEAIVARKLRWAREDAQGIAAAASARGR